DLEFVGDAKVVAVAADAVADDRIAVRRLAHLRLGKRLDHAMLHRHATNPFVGLHSHRGGRDPAKYATPQGEFPKALRHQLAMLEASILPCHLEGSRRY